MGGSRVVGGRIQENFDFQVFWKEWKKFKKIRSEDRKENICEL